MSTTLPTSTATRRKRKRSRLMEAVTAGNVEKIIKLIVNCDPNFIDEATGETPLSLAANTPAASTTIAQRVIVALVNGGALLDFRGKDGRTPLHCAVQKSNYVALKTFLDLGASPNYRDSHNLTPLFYTILYKSNPKLTQLLLHEHSVHGVVDQQGWQEVHHACKLGLVAHLEQLLYYGCDMNCKIVGSGNTPLHVAAINDQMDCARVLLLRGCNTQIANNSHQTAYQVAVIAGNMNLAELIANHKSEHVVPYRDKPKYNPARRPPSVRANIPPFNASSDAPSSVSMKHQHVHSGENMRKILCGNAYGLQSATKANGSYRSCLTSSPCPSQSSCNTSTTNTTSSGVCCELDGSQSSSEVADDDVSGGRGSGVAVCESEDDSTTEKTLSQYSRVEGRREQKLIGIGSSTTLPARGRREQQQMHYHSHPNSDTKSNSQHPHIQQSMSLSLTRSGPSTDSISTGSILPADLPPITSYDEKTVSLHRGQRGFGFVLRGAKATSPVLKQAVQDLTTQPQPISLQYLDEIEPNGVAECAGLRRGDFLINVNGVDVRSAPHEQVVQLIRHSGDKVTMTVATPIFLETDNESDTGKEKKMSEQEKTDASSDFTSSSKNSEKDFAATIPRSSASSSLSTESRERSQSRTRAPPAPPKRDPSTTLSIGRARARSLCMTSGSNAEGEEENNAEGAEQPGTHSNDRKVSKTIDDSCAESKANGIDLLPAAQQKVRIRGSSTANIGGDLASKIASIRSRNFRRISAFELGTKIGKYFSAEDGSHYSVHDDSGKNQKADPKEREEDGGKADKGSTLQALKRRRMKKLKKEFHSTPDIQEQLIAASEKEIKQNHHKMFMMTMSEKLGSPKFDKNGNRLSTSQENLSRSSFIITPSAVGETLTLKDGKIVSSTLTTVTSSAALRDSTHVSAPGDDTAPSSLHNQNSLAANRSAPPNHPPPPPPTNKSGNSSFSVVVKVDLSHKHAKSDYANFSLIENGENDTSHADTPITPLSSFKPPLPLPNDSETSSLSDTGSSNKKSIYCSSDKLKQQTLTGNSNRTLRAPVIDQIGSENSEALMSSSSQSQPFIPEPDYSSEDDVDVTTNVSGRDLSTFKRGSTGKSSSTFTDSSTRMAQSYHEDESKSKEQPIPTSFSGLESVVSRDKNIEFENQLKSKVQNFAANSASKAVALSKLVERDADKTGKQEESSNSIQSGVKASDESVAINNETISSHGLTTTTMKNDGSSLKPHSEHLNKVKESILVFERKSSTTDLATGTLKFNKKDYHTNNTSSESSAVPASNADITNNSTLRMSKSCFEVDVCDNISRVSSISADGSQTATTDVPLKTSSAASAALASNSSIRSQQIHTLNRRNSAIVSEKIATLMASSSMGTKSGSVTETLPSVKVSSQVHTNQQDLGSCMLSTHARRSSIDAVPLDKEKSGQSSSSTIRIAVSSTASEVPSISGHKAAPTTAKTWSEISSAIRAAKGGVGASVTGSTGAVTTASPCQSVAATKTMASNRPTSAPIIHKKINSVEGKTMPQQQSSAGVPVDSLSLAPVNKGDLSNWSDLVPPPPEFAAPPPLPIDVRSNQTIIQSMVNVNEAQKIRSKSAMQYPTRLSSSPSKKDESRLMNNAGHKIHIVHKPTPHQQPIQSCYYATLANQSQQIRKSNTPPPPPPPPPPEFSDISAAARLGVAGQGVLRHHHLAQQQPNPYQVKMQYAVYPTGDTRQYQSYLHQSQPQQFATITRYAVKPQAQPVPRHTRCASSDQIQMSRSLGSESSTVFACAGIADPYRQHPMENRYAYQQFATLSRGRPDQLATQGATSYSDYTRLTVQNRLLRQQQGQLQAQQIAQAHLSSQPQQRICTGHHHHQQQPQYYSDSSKQQKQNQSHSSLGHSHLHSQALQAHLHSHQHQIAPAMTAGNAPSQITSTSINPPQPHQPPPPGPPPSLHKAIPAFPQRSMVDWEEEDVKDWITSIGMVEHRSKFEYINGVKLLRLDGNDLSNIGIRPTQHRSFILEKVKQHLHYQQQHPPAP